MFTWLKNILIGKYLGSVLRHILTGAAGYLIAMGIVNKEQGAELTRVLVDIVPGLLAYIVAQLASFENKKG